VLEVAGGTLTSYPGDYDDYLTPTARTRETAPARSDDKLLRPSPAPVPAPADRRLHAERRHGRASGAVRALRRPLEAAERQIHDLEGRLGEFAEALSDPELYKDGDRVRALSTERKTAEEQVAWLMREWEELSVELSAHE